MTNVNERSTSISLSVTGDFMGLWKSYLEATGRKSYDVVHDIVENPENYFDFNYSGKGTKLTMGLVCKFKDKEELQNMFDSRERSKNMCEMLYTYMKKNPYICVKVRKDGKIVYEPTTEIFEVK